MSARIYKGFRLIRRVHYEQPLVRGIVGYVMLAKAERLYMAPITVMPNSTSAQASYHYGEPLLIHGVSVRKRGDQIIAEGPKVPPVVLVNAQGDEFLVTGGKQLPSRKITPRVPTTIMTDQGEDYTFKFIHGVGHVVDKIRRKISNTDRWEEADMRPLGAAAVDFDKINAARTSEEIAQAHKDLDSARKRLQTTQEINDATKKARTRIVR